MKIVEAHHVGNAVCLGGTEADTAQDTGNEGDESILFGAVSNFAHFDEFGGEEETTDVGFGFFPLAVLLAEGFAHALAVGYGVLDAKTVSHFVEADIAEECIEVHIVQLVVANQQVGNGLKDGLELGLHGVLKLQTAGTHGFVDALVVGQVDGDGLGTRVAVTGVVNDVVDIEVPCQTNILHQLQNIMLFQIFQNFQQVPKVPFFSPL